MTLAIDCSSGAGASIGMEGHVPLHFEIVEGVQKYMSNEPLLKNCWK